MSVASLFAVLAMVTDTLCARVEASVSAADIHVRCRAPFSIEWCDAATAAAQRLVIDVRRDNIYGDKASVEYIVGTDSVTARPDSVIAHWDVDVKDAYGPVSLRLAKDLYGTHLYAVNGEELEAADMDIDFAVGSPIVVRYDSRVRPTIARAPIVYRFKPHKYGMNSDRLTAYMAESSDITEGLWEFMDSDIGVEGTMVTAPLRIATLRDGAGYAIVYLSGYDSLGVWQRMDIKGRLMPTSFVRDYDLQWYCADGAELGGQLHATLDEGGSILTLNLGAQPMSVRFRRFR